MQACAAPGSAGPVVCGIPDPCGSTELAHLALAVAARLGTGTVLVHVQPPTLLPSSPQIAFAAPDVDPTRDTDAAQAGLARLASDAGAPPSTRLRVELGDPAERLVATARSERAPLLVAGTRATGPWGRAIHGSVLAGLIPDAPCPVLVLPPALVGRRRRALRGLRRLLRRARGRPVTRRSSDETDDLLTGPIVCGVDDSAGSRAALRVADRVAHLLDRRLVVAHVVADGGGADVDTIIREVVGAGAERRLTTGEPSAQLAALADAEHAAAIVVGARGRGRLAAALLGSVSSGLIDAAHCLVVVVPPHMGDRSDVARHPLVGDEYDL